MITGDVKILFFGITGALGTAFEIIASKHSIELVGLTHNDIDITDELAVEKMIDTHKANVVINGVAIVGIDPCEMDPKSAFAVHCTAVWNMAHCCAQRNIIFIQPSSHAVFDGKASHPYLEDDQPLPLNVYGVTKLVGDHIALNTCQASYVVRFPTMFGPRRNKNLGFVDKMVEQLGNNQKIKVAQDKIDSPTYTLDAAEGVLSLIQQTAPYGLYHIANKGVVNYFELITELARLMESNSSIQSAKNADFPSTTPKPLYTSMATKKWQPLREWRSALADYVKTLS